MEICRVDIEKQLTELLGELMILLNIINVTLLSRAKTTLAHNKCNTTHPCLLSCCCKYTFLFPFLKPYGWFYCPRCNMLYNVTFRTSSDTGVSEECLISLKKSLI